MKILVIDVGGTHIKVLLSGEQEPRKFASGPAMTAKQMVAGVKEVTVGLKYDVVSIGFPGPVLGNRPIAEPFNLGGGWVGFNFESAFGCPVKLVNDAAMQALGSYRGGKMLFIDTHLAAKGENRKTKPEIAALYRKEFPDVSEKTAKNSVAFCASTFRKRTGSESNHLP